MGLRITKKAEFAGFSCGGLNCTLRQVLEYSPQSTLADSAFFFSFRAAFVVASGGDNAMSAWFPCPAGPWAEALSGGALYIVFWKNKRSGRESLQQFSRPLFSFQFTILFRAAHSCGRVTLGFSIPRRSIRPGGADDVSCRGGGGWRRSNSLRGRSRGSTCIRPASCNPCMRRSPFRRSSSCSGSPCSSIPSFALFVLSLVLCGEGRERQGREEYGATQNYLLHCHFLLS